MLILFVWGFIFLGILIAPPVIILLGLALRMFGRRLLQRSEENALPRGDVIESEFIDMAQDAPQTGQDAEPVLPDNRTQIPNGRP